MKTEIEEHITAVKADFASIFGESNGRISGGQRLWSQLNESVASLRKNGLKQAQGVIERVNELMVARELLRDPTLSGALIEYEPEVVKGRPRFDFVVKNNFGRTLYLEVKTVQPKLDESKKLAKSSR